MSRSIFSNESFIDWLKKQPADQEYDYFDACNCLLSQYFHELGFPHVTVGATTVCLNSKLSEGLKALPSGWNDVAMSVAMSSEIAIHDDWAVGDPPFAPAAFDTFGEALKRAEKLLISEPA